MTEKHEGTECSRWLFFDRSFRSRGFANRIDRKAVRLEYGSKKSTKSWNSPITSPLIESQTWQIRVFNQAKNRFREQSLFLRFKEVQVTLYVMNISHTIDHRYKNRHHVTVTYFDTTAKIYKALNN